jgi:two-component system, NarL family, invasion response regulator UvrY
MIKILIADDHAIVRRGLTQIVAEEPDMVVAGEAQNEEEVLALLGNGEWDVVILDITMPGRSGLEVLRGLRQTRPTLPVLILSMHPEDQFAVRALKAGAAGYMTKEAAPDELVKAIRKVLEGGKYVSSTLAEKLVRGLAPRAERVPLEALSEREYQVMKMIASGWTVSTIAEELKLSVKTVSTYRARILAKMRLRSNAELTHYAIQNGLVSWEPQP